MKSFSVNDEDVGMRVDLWLAKYLPHIPKTHLRKLIEMGALTCTTPGKVHKGNRVKAQEVYTFTVDPTPMRLQPNGSIPLSLLFEDEAILVLNKPAGINCQPNQPNETDTLANALLHYLPELMGVGDNDLTCGILHRIDYDTSGLVLVAKTQPVYEALRKQFADRMVTKTYCALAHGEITRAVHLVNELAHNPRCPGRIIDATQWRDAKRPMHAETTIAPRQICHLHDKLYTLLKVTILTGVTHQIRAQLSLAGHPLLGDKRYGGPLLPGFNRHFLHAEAIEFRHPLTHAPVKYIAPLTTDLLDLLSSALIKRNFQS